jgi:hypothetical protein
MKYIFIIIFNVTVVNVFCQADSAKFVRYDFSFMFNDGLYLDFSGVKNNEPIPFERLAEPSRDDDSFFELLDNCTVIKYYDDFGSLKEISMKDIWGYGRNGKPHIYWHDKFNLIPYIGSISYFFTIVTVQQYYQGSYDPFYGTYYNNYYYPSGTYKSEELRQFFIDFETGRVFSSDPKNVEKLLSKAPDLQKEYSKLGKRKKNKRMVEYVRRYNEMFPLYVKKSENIR